MKVHSFLMYGELSRLQKLTIKSFQTNYYNFVLYTYNDDLNFDCEIRDLRDILPEFVIFYYKNLGEQYKYGGITERIKAEMLYKLGGLHVDLDVTCLKPFDTTAPYIFRPHKLGVVANIIKAKAGSDFAKDYLESTKLITEDSNDYENSIKGLMPAVERYGLQKYIVSEEIFGRDEDDWWMPLLKYPPMYPPPERCCIHWCNALGREPEPNSFLDLLFQQYDV